MFGGRSGAEKKDAAMSFVSAALQLSDAVTSRHIVDEEKFKEGLSKVIDGTVLCLNASTWSKPVSAITSSDFFAPVLQRLFDLSHELVGDGAIDEAVIVAQGQVDQGADRDGVIAIFVGDNDRRFCNPAHTHNGRVRLIDDGQTENCAKLARD